MSEMLLTSLHDVVEFSVRNYCIFGVFSFSKTDRLLALDFALFIEVAEFPFILDMMSLAEIPLLIEPVKESFLERIAAARFFSPMLGVIRPRSFEADLPLLGAGFCATLGVELNPLLFCAKLDVALI